LGDRGFEDQRLEQTAAAPGRAEFGPQFFELCAQPLCGVTRSGLKINSEHGRHHGEGSRAHERVCMIGAPLFAGLEGVHRFGTQGGTDGNAAAEPFAESHDIGADGLVFGTKKRPGAAHSRLHFVEDEKNAVRVGDAAKRLEIPIRRNDDSRLALDGFDQERNGALGDGALHGCGVAVGNVGKAGNFRWEEICEARFARCRHAGEGAAVKGVFGGDDLERA
jgi:hypothetical protein